ncbi:MAG: hypothetical protein NTZ41_06940 [Sphingobacteriales bacterium]|nr:hypothetical protein [Sphingobacteriales bacterium]
MIPPELAQFFRFCRSSFKSHFKKRDTLKLTTAPKAASRAVCKVSAALIFNRTTSTVPPTVPAMVSG